MAEMANFDGMNPLRPGRKAGYRAATFRLPPDVIRLLDEYSARTGKVKGFVVEQALRGYLARCEELADEEI